MPDPESITAWTAAASAVGGATYGAYRVIIPKIQKHLSKVNELLDLIPCVKRLDEVVMKELRPNGGTSLKDAINEIRRSLAILDGRLHILAEQHGLISWESDAAGRCIWVSTAMLRMLGRQPDEILGSNWRSIIHCDDRERVYREWDSAVRDGRTFILRYRWVRSDGTDIPIAAEAHILKDKSGEIVGYASIVREITCKSEGGNCGH